MTARATVSLSTALFRAVRLRCPHCGQGRLFRAYLKPVDQCAACGEAFGHIRADDGPAWLTILVVGHIVVPLALYAIKYTDWSDMMIGGLALALILSLTVLLLPCAKGAFIGFLWSAKAHGSEID
ncbi:MAG: DUF983 domain-containing protein [Alphaproteobacteria bacterium]